MRTVLCVQAGKRGAPKINHESKSDEKNNLNAQIAEIKREISKVNAGGNLNRAYFIDRSNTWKARGIMKKLKNIAENIKAEGKDDDLKLLQNLLLTPGYEKMVKRYNLDEPKILQKMKKGEL